MKKLYSFLSTCTIFVFSVSCSTTQQIGRNGYVTTNHDTRQLEVLQDVVIAGGGYATGIHEKENVFDVELVLDGSTTDYSELQLSKISKIFDSVHLNKSLHSFIENWYGVPYKFGGTGRKGIDCSAFVRELYKNVYDIDLLRTSREQYTLTNPVKSLNELKEGDLVFFKIRTRAISHVGVYLSNGQFVHASRSKGVVISNLSDAYWSRYYVGGGRVVGENEG